MRHWINATISDCHYWNDQLCSLFLRGPLPHFEAGQFVTVGLEIDGEVVARPYSLVNAPGAADAEIYFNRVPDGPLSTRLFQCQVGDSLLVSDRPAGYFVLSEVPVAKHLWLLGTGTGIGPYLSILQSATPWQRFEQVILVHGVKHRDELTHQALIQTLAREHGQQFCYVSALSRDQDGDDLQGRITDAIAQGALERKVGLPITAADAQVMLCGNPGFVADAAHLLKTRGMTTNLRRKPGHITREVYQ